MTAPGHPDAIDAVRLAVEDILPALLRGLNDEIREHGSVDEEALRNGMKWAAGNAIEAAWPYLRDKVLEEVRAGAGEIGGIMSAAIRHAERERILAGAEHHAVSITAEVDLLEMSVLRELLKAGDD